MTNITGAKGTGAFGQSEKGSSSEWRRVRKQISAFVHQLQLRREARSVIQKSRSRRERTAATRTEVREVEERYRLSKEGVLVATPQPNVLEQKASASWACMFVRKQSGMKIAKRPSLLPCPECGVPAKVFQEVNGVVRASVFCGNSRCRRPAIYYGTVDDAAARWNRYAAGRKQVNKVGK